MSNTEFARELRHRQTDAERMLWSRLRNRQIDGWKFKRQVPVGPYVLDFFCFEANLVIEVDGGQHAEDRVASDQRRTQFLEADGLNVIRFWNREVLNDIDGVIDLIYRALGQGPAPSPGALKRQQNSEVSSGARRPLPEGRGKVAPVWKAGQK